MHAGNPDRSARLAKTLAVLKAWPNGVTTVHLQKSTGSMAPATDVSELRAAGHLIDCNQEPMQNNRRIFRYTYKGKS